MSNQITKRGLLCLFTFACLLLSNTEVLGQIEKGSFQVGGTASFLNNKTETTSQTNPQTLISKNNNGTFGPAFGYFVSDNLSLGIQLGFGSNKVENEDFDSSINSFQYGVYGRWHKVIVDRFYFFSSLSLLLGNAQTETLNSLNGQTTKVDLSNFTTQLAPGLTYFVTDWMSFETSLNLFNYSSTKAEAEDNSFTQNTDSFNFNLDLTNVNLGLVFYF